MSFVTGLPTTTSLLGRLSLFTDIFQYQAIQREPDMVVHACNLNRRLRQEGMAVSGMFVFSLALHLVSKLLKYCGMCKVTGFSLRSKMSSQVGISLDLLT